MDRDSINEGFMALCVSILCSVPPERSFEILGCPSRTIRQPRLDITQDDVRDMAKLKAAGETYKAIGEMYGITDSAVYRRIKRLK